MPPHSHFSVMPRAVAAHGGAIPRSWRLLRPNLQLPRRGRWRSLSEDQAGRIVMAGCCNSQTSSQDCSEGSETESGSSRQFIAHWDLLVEKGLPAPKWPHPLGYRLTCAKACRFPCRPWQFPNLSSVKRDRPEQQNACLCFEAAAQAVEVAVPPQKKVVASIEYGQTNIRYQAQFAARAASGRKNKKSLRLEHQRPLFNS